MAKPFQRNAKNSFLVLLIVGCISTLVIFHYLTLSPGQFLRHTILYELSSSIVSGENYKKLQDVPLRPKLTITNFNHKTRETFPSLTATRLKVKKEIQDFLHYIHKNESQLIPELGGIPIRCMLSTTWRSGSTFIGRSLAIHPGAFYHYEPLWAQVGIHRIRSLSMAQNALNELENQLLCNYTALQRRGVNLPEPNRTLWFGQPKKRHSLEEISSYCSLCPVQIVKILRLGSRLLKPLLENPNLNLRVIMMVRDPRALLHSRKNLAFCFGECKDATLICQDYYDDYKILKELQNVFPDRIMGIRFEDITSNPEKVIPELYDFCGLLGSESLQEDIRAHTKPNHKDFIRKTAYNTFRNTSNVSFEWREGLTWTEIDDIQRKCTEAMNVWGYNKVDKDSKINVETFTANIP